MSVLFSALLAAPLPRALQQETTAPSPNYAAQGIATGVNYASAGASTGQGWAQGTETTQHTLQTFQDLAKQTTHEFKRVGLQNTPSREDPSTRRNLNDQRNTFVSQGVQTAIDYAHLGTRVGLGWITGTETPKSTAQQFGHLGGETTDHFAHLSGVETNITNPNVNPTPNASTLPQHVVDAMAHGAHSVLGWLDQAGRRLLQSDEK